MSNFEESVNHLDLSSALSSRLHESWTVNWSNHAFKNIRIYSVIQYVTSKTLTKEKNISVFPANNYLGLFEFEPTTYFLNPKCSKSSVKPRILMMHFSCYKTLLNFSRFLVNVSKYVSTNWDQFTVFELTYITWLKNTKYWLAKKGLIRDNKLTAVLLLIERGNKLLILFNRFTYVYTFYYFLFFLPVS